MRTILIQTKRDRSRIRQRDGFGFSSIQPLSKPTLAPNDCTNVYILREKISN
ncbi:MAG: hypothetical protein KME10_11605 [Plectolyngbya sp. WJT66-NPBG17]|nr:hypothetical protein [Plectolyngbya sp. WJT66-NPBG17]